MNIKIYINGREADIVPQTLIPILANRVEVHLIKGLQIFDDELIKHNYTILISFPTDFKTYKITTEGLPAQLRNLLAMVI